MMNIQNILLLLMFASYFVCIYTVYEKYCQLSQSPSISHILCDEEVWGQVMLGMLAMCFFTILYEGCRGHSASFNTMIGLLIGIVGVLTFPVHIYHSTHYTFAFLVFLSILAWMTSICAFYDGDMIKFLVFFQYLTAFMIVSMVVKGNESIIIPEVLFLIIFFVFFMTIHFKETKSLLVKT